MPTESKPVAISVIEDKPLPIATFKNSLRAWLVRWKAERIHHASVSDQTDNQTPPE
jgi:hypothetical protein